MSGGRGSVLGVLVIRPAFNIRMNFAFSFPLDLCGQRLIIDDYAPTKTSINKHIVLYHVLLCSIAATIEFSICAISYIFVVLCSLCRSSPSRPPLSKVELHELDENHPLSTSNRSESTQQCNVLYTSQIQSTNII